MRRTRHDGGLRWYHAGDTREAHCVATNRLHSMAPDAGTRIPTIGIITTWIDSDYWTAVLAGASDALRAAGASVVCFTLGYSDAVGPQHRRGERDPFFALANTAAIDGLIVPTPASFGANATEFFAARAGLPMASVGAEIPGVPSVIADNAGGTEALLRHLIEDCGLTRIGYIRGLETNPEAQARFAAFRAVLAAASLPCDEHLVAKGDWMEPSGARAAASLLALAPERRPQAIVAANDLMALGALRAVRERGLWVPGDVAIAGFDDIEAVQGSPPLTTVRQPAVELGRCAAGLVLDQLKGAPVSPLTTFPTELIVRASTPPVSLRTQVAAAAGRPSLLPTTGPVETATRFLVHGHAPPPLSASTQLVARLREEVFPHLTADPAAQHRVETVLTELEALLSATTTEAVSLHKAAESAQAQALLQLRRAAARATSFAALIDEISELVPALDMDAFFLVLFDGVERGRARLVLANEMGRRIPLRLEGLEFDASTLIPPSLRRRGEITTSVAQPLVAGDRRLGYVLMRGRLYDAHLLGDVCQVVGMALARFAPPAP